MGELDPALAIHEPLRAANPLALFEHLAMVTSLQSYELVWKHVHVHTPIVGAAMPQQDQMCVVPMLSADDQANDNANTQGCED